MSVSLTFIIIEFSPVHPNLFFCFRTKKNPYISKPLRMATFTIVNSLQELNLTHSLGKSINSLVFTAKIKPTNNLVKVKQYKPTKFFDADIVMDDDKTEEEIMKAIDSDRLTLVRDVFLRAGQTLSTLEHPNLPKVIGVLVPVDSLNFGIITEYFKGQSLQQILADETSKLRLASIPVETRLTWIAQLADALDYLHNHGILHRNLQKANVIINLEEQTIMLTDFYAQVLVDAEQEQEEEEEEEDDEEEEGEENDEEEEEEEEQESKAGTTEMRMLNLSKLVDFDAPPELRLRQTFSTESDVYCLSVVAWQLLCCEVPFAREANRFRLKKQVLGKTQLRPSLTSLGSILQVDTSRKETIVETIKQGWAADLRTRPTMQAFASAFSQRLP